jgi:hypothetical protein
MLLPFWFSKFGGTIYLNLHFVHNNYTTKYGYRFLKGMTYLLNPLPASSSLSKLPVLIFDGGSPRSLILLVGKSNHVFRRKQCRWYS